MFTPSTVVRLLAGVDISNSYINTFSFPTATAQASFFTGKTVYSYTDFHYVRKSKTLKVPTNIESLWNVNYMMFQNANFGSKWFYAFITDMEYVNDGTTEIKFEIDVMQTWFFDMDVKDCFVEREHVHNDLIGANLVEENLNVGELVVDDYYQPSALEPIIYVIASTHDTLGNPVNGQKVTGNYTGIAYYASTNINFVNDFITALTNLGKASAIQHIFTMAEALVDTTTTRVDQPAAKNVSISLSKNNTTIDGYTPRNNKLFSFPYNYLYVTNNQGSSNVFKYEYFGQTTCEFIASGDVGANPTVFLLPLNYKDAPINYDELLTLTSFPVCAWTTDFYQNWLAQNQVSNAINVGGSLLALGGGIATANPLAIGGGALGVASSIGNFYEKSIVPNQMHGSISGAGNLAIANLNFGFYKKCVTYQNAKIIDDYFHAYGYKVNSLKVPNITGRTNWNYVKVRDSNIYGDIPNLHLQKIHKIFKDGVTFWHNDNVGDYQRDNIPL